MQALRSIPIFQFTPLREGRPSSARHSIPLIVFQFTPLREGRRGVYRISAPSRQISIHAPPRGATFIRDNCACQRGFQFTPLREGRPESADKLVEVNLFQFTPLREGRRISKAISGCEARFQFTPLREGRHSFARAVYLHQFISIHAPPRGATERASIRAGCR